MRPWEWSLRLNSFAAGGVAASHGTVVEQLSFVADAGCETIGLWFGAQDPAELGDFIGTEGIVGISFSAVDIPAVTLTSAVLGVTIASVATPHAFTIKAEAVAAPTAITTPHRPSTWALTTASTAVGSGSTTGAKNYTVTSIIQELLNLPGWASGNRINMHLRDDGFIAGQGIDFSLSSVSVMTLTLMY